MLRVRRTEPAASPSSIHPFSWCIRDVRLAPPNRGTPFEDALPAIASPYGLGKDVEIFAVIDPVVQGRQGFGVPLE